LIKNGESVDTKHGIEGNEIGGEDYSLLTVDEMDAGFKAFLDEMNAIEDAKEKAALALFGSELGDEDKRVSFPVQDATTGVTKGTLGVSSKSVSFSENFVFNRILEVKGSGKLLGIQDSSNEGYSLRRARYRRKKNY
jgi:hypothetical protein